MAFVNLPPNFKDMFSAINDRLAKLETQPNQAMYTAVEANTNAAQGMAEAQAAYAVGIQAQNEATQALIAAQASYALSSQSLIKSANTITNASNQITGINGNGITVYSGTSSTSGARVVLNSAGLAGYNGSGTATFAIDASTGAVSTNGAIFTSSTISGGSLNINGNCTINSSGLLTAYGATINGTITSNAATITGGSLTVGSSFQVNTSGILTASGVNISGTVTASAGSIGGFTITSSYLSGSGGFTLNSNGTIDGGNSNRLYYGYINIGGGTAGTERLIVTGNSNFNGTAIFTGNTTSQTHFYSPFATNVTSAANGYWVSSSGRMTYTTASSQRYKHDIVDLISIPEYNPKKLLDLPVRAFRYNEGYVTPTDDRADVLLPGFIAEEVDAIYPIACDYSETNGPESWNDRILLPAMLSLIQDQEARIKTLEGN
jgi:hypothetical protein